MSIQNKSHSSIFRHPFSWEMIFSLSWRMCVCKPKWLAQMYIYTCMHACINTYIHTNIHTYILWHTYLHAYVHVCTPSCMCVLSACSCPQVSARCRVLNINMQTWFPYMRAISQHCRHAKLLWIISFEWYFDLPEACGGYNTHTASVMLRLHVRKHKDHHICFYPKFAKCECTCTCVYVYMCYMCIMCIIFDVQIRLFDVYLSVFLCIHTCVPSFSTFRHPWCMCIYVCMHLKYILVCHVRTSMNVFMCVCGCVCDGVCVNIYIFIYIYIYIYILLPELPDFMHPTSCEENAYKHINTLYVELAHVCANSHEYLFCMGNEEMFIFC